MTAYDSYALKNMLQNQLFTNNILNNNILEAFLNVDRVKFLPSNYSNAAYVDDNVKIDDNAYSLNPLNIAKLIDIIDIDPKAMVMELGTDLGYASVILSSLFRHVLTLKSSHQFIQGLQDTINSMSINNIDIEKTNNLLNGCNKYQPYDHIFIFKALNDIPNNLITQLKDGGSLLMYKKLSPSNLSNDIVLAEALKIIKLNEGDFKVIKYFTANVPILNKE